MSCNEREVPDPQYLWMLPKYIELMVDPQYSTISNDQLDQSDIEQFSGYFLSWLISPRVFQTVNWKVQHVEDEARKLRAEYLECEEFSWPPIRLFYYGKAHKSLKHIGLDVRGGKLQSLADTVAQMKEDEPGFPTNGLIVLDVEKAEKRVNLGYKLSNEDAFSPSSIDLEEAVAKYFLILSLTSPSGEPIPTTKEIIEKIEEAEVNEQETWILKREKFRLEVRERYRKLVVDMALEEHLSELKSKTRRLIGLG